MSNELSGNSGLLTNAQYYLAETICDEISSADSDDKKMFLAEIRHKYICASSGIGKHRCSIETAHGYCCDTCLQPELHDLWSVGVKTIGSCCGHGILVPYIQVAPQYVQKMHELGYCEREPDGKGNGINCFIPKTFLPVIDARCANCKKAVKTGDNEYMCGARDFSTLTKWCYVPRESNM